MKLFSCIAAISILLAGSGICAADVTRSEATDRVQESKVAYTATYPEGGREKILVAYEAYVYHKIWETGEPSTPPFHPVDTRRCHLAVSAWVQRRAYLVSHSGVNAPIEDYSHRWDSQESLSRGPEKPWEIYHVSCNTALNQFQSRVAETKANLGKNFNTIVKADDDATRSMLKAMLLAQGLVAQK